MTTLQRIQGMCLSLVAVLVVQVAVAAGSPVEELSKRLPDNTIGFVATSGVDFLKADFDKSILGQIWNDPNMRTFCTTIWTQVQTRLAREKPDANALEYVAMAMEYASLLAGRPMAVGVAQVDIKKEPPVCAFAIVDAADRKPQLSDAVARLESQFGKGKVVEAEVASLKVHGIKDGNDLNVYWGWAGNYLVVVGNDTKGTAIQYLDKPRASPPEYFKKVPVTDDAMVVHYDVKKIAQMLMATMAKQGGKGDPNGIRTVLTQLGLDKVTAITGRAGFSGVDLVEDAFVEAPEPRTGLLAAIKPVDLSLLGMVDANAVEAHVANCDLAAVYDTIMNTMKAVSPDEGYPEIQKGLADLEAKVKFSVRKDLLGSLAGPVVFYSLPAGKMLEAPTGGFVIVAKLKDAPLFEKTMASLGTSASSQSDGMLQVGDRKEGDQTIHVWSIAPLALAQVMPAWSVVGDNVVVGSNVALNQTAMTYVASAAKHPKSLLDTAGYRKVAAGLPKNIVKFTYVDTQLQFSQMMTGIQQVWPMAVMMATKEGVNLPVMLPNLGRITKQMQPGCQYTYFTPDGLHSHYQGSGIEVSVAGVAGAAVGAGILMPALARTRQLAFRMTSGTNLAGIGKACLIYANDHDDNLPPNLEALVKGVELSPKSLESNNKPKDFGGPSFVYVAGQTTSMPLDNIVAYENPEFCIDGVNVLYLDSHVEFVKPQQFREQLAQTYKRLSREMPPIRFKGEAQPVVPPGPGTRSGRGG